MLMFITRLQGITSHKGQLIAQTCENVNQVVPHRIEKFYFPWNI